MPAHLACWKTWFANCLTLTQVLHIARSKSLSVIQDAWTPTGGQSLGRHSRRVNPRGIPAIFQMVCQAFLLITFAFSGCLRSVEARNYCANRIETGTQIGKIGKTKNCIGYQIRKVFFAKTENQMLKNRKSANSNEHQSRKTEFFLTQKNWKTDLKNSQNRKTENPDAPSFRRSLDEFWTLKEICLDE